MKTVILLPDALHINTRNFASFHQYVEKNSIQLHVNKDRQEWLTLFGEYDSKDAELRTKIDLLAMASPDNLFNYRFHGINLFQVARAETLTRIIPRRSWHSSAYPTSLRGVFDRLYAEHKSVLLQNMAAAIDWIEFWRAKLPTLSPQPTHACIFSGGLIYQRTLLELLRTTTTKAIVMESFFTGNDYYFEEKYEAIANNSDLRFDALYDAMAVPTDPMEYDRERMKAINKVILTKNKNVQQPEDSKPLPFKDSARPLVFVLGQVVNDLSLLNYKGRGLSSVMFYKELILQLVRDGGCDVVFKDHPWEMQKAHVKRPFTRQLLQEWLESVPDVAAHVAIGADYNIHDLFKQCDFAVGLNTQSLIEAAHDGLKPVQFGNAFYGRRGFTHDYDLQAVPQFVADLRNGRLSGTLTLAEIDAYERFLVKSLQSHLVSVHPSGVATLARKMTPAQTINLAKRPTAAPAREVKEASTPPVTPKPVAPVAPPKAPPTAAKPAPVPPKTALVRGTGTPIVVDSPELQAALANPKPAKAFRAKLRKFFRDPRSFFRDSRFIRAFG